MENETIKIFTKVQNTVEALRLAEAGEALFFRRDADGSYFTRHLKSIECNASLPYEIKVDGYFRYCYTATEIDPCQSPDGCSDLKPWMVYLGLGKDIPESDGRYYVSNATGQWFGGAGAFNSSGGVNDLSHYAIDVRTPWAKAAFPEHCRIRAYGEPRAMDVAWEAYRTPGMSTLVDMGDFQAGWNAAMAKAAADNKV